MIDQIRTKQMKILRQRMFISHEDAKQKTIKNEYTIKSNNEQLTNIIILSDKFMPDLQVSDDRGHTLPIMPTKDIQRLLSQFIKKSKNDMQKILETINSDINSGILYVIWIRIPKHKAMIKNEIRTFTLTYSPYTTNTTDSLLAIRIKKQPYPLYYTLFTPDQFNFGQTRYKYIKNDSIELNTTTPDNVQKFKTNNSNTFRISNNVENFDILYSFKPASIASRPTKIGLWTLTGLSLLALISKHVYPELFDSGIFEVHVEIGLFTIGGSLILPQLANNISVRARYTKWYWVPIIFGALLLI